MVTRISAGVEARPQEGHGRDPGMAPHSPSEAPLPILTFTTLYPSAVRPQHGIFVETRLRKLVDGGAVTARVVAPCPWFPFASPRFGEYARFARTPRREERHGIAIEHPRYPLLPKIGMSTAPPALALAVLPLLRRQIAAGRDFALIDAHYFYPDGVAAVLLGRALGRPVVITARGSDLNLIAEYMMPRRWIRWAAARADGLVCVSPGLRLRLVGLGTDAERVRVLRNGVDLALFRRVDPEAARRALGLKRPTLLAVGNLVALKRHTLMVEALPLLSDADLVVVGEGPERTAIENLARRLGVDERVRLLGHLPQEQLPAVYSAADLLLLMSTHEGWPNVLLESMACGTPVVVSDFAGVADIVAAAEAGQIVSGPTPQSLANAIREALAAPPDHVATRAYAAGFDWQSTTDGQIALFGDIAERRRRGSAPAARGYPRRTRS
jgi:teichuronic acid biosynthesis glycosyltransferase TuaC